MLLPRAPFSDRRYLNNCFSVLSPCASKSYILDSAMPSFATTFTSYGGAISGAEYDSVTRNPLQIRVFPRNNWTIYSCGSVV